MKCSRMSLGAAPHQLDQRDTVIKHPPSFHALGVIIGESDALRASGAPLGQVGKPRKPQG